MKTEGDKFTANQNKQKNEIKDSKLIGQTKKEQPVPQIVETVKTAVPNTRQRIEQVPTVSMKVKTAAQTTPTLKGSGLPFEVVAAKKFDNEKFQSDKDKKKAEQVVPRISSSKKRINTQLIDQKKSYEEDHLVYADDTREANQAYLSA